VEDARKRERRNVCLRSWHPTVEVAASRWRSSLAVFLFILPLYFTLLQSVFHLFPRLGSLLPRAVWLHVQKHHAHNLPEPSRGAHGGTNRAPRPISLSNQWRRQRERSHGSGGNEQTSGCCQVDKKEIQMKLIAKAFGTGEKIKLKKSIKRSKMNQPSFPFFTKRCSDGGCSSIYTQTESSIYVFVHSILLILLFNYYYWAHVKLMCWDADERRHGHRLVAVCRLSATTWEMPERERERDNINPKRLAGAGERPASLAASPHRTVNDFCCWQSV